MKRHRKEAKCLISFKLTRLLSCCTPCGAIFVILPRLHKMAPQRKKIKQGNTYMSRSNQTNNYTEFCYHFFRNILVVSLPLLIISALILSLPHSSANGVDTLTLTLSSSCTMSSIVDIEHNGSLTSGTYIQNIGQTTIKTLCNDGNGYSVYAVGYSNNEEGNNKLINTEYPQYSIDTGLNTSGLTSAWAMKLNNIPDDPSPTPPTIESDYDNVYGIVPSYWTKVASRASGTTDMDEGSSFTTTYAVYASSNQHAGTYVGQVKYVLTHPSYQPYVYYMQEVDKWKNTLALEQSVQATDLRDGKSYWVTKLQDGHIWMTQNLDFDINSNTILDSITTDLNVIYNSSTRQYAEYNSGYTENNGIIYWKPTNTTIDFQNTGPITDWMNSDTKPYSASKTDSTETSHASLGNWYNWTAAIASNDSSSLTQDTISDISKNPQNSICPKGWRLPTVSNQSETLPGSTNEFSRLGYLYNSVLSAPLFFTKYGYIQSSGLTSLGTDGMYASSNSYTKGGAWAANIEGVNFAIDYWLNGRDGRGGGWSVRCVVR